MRVAIVGCGYVADLYMATLPFYSDLDCVGVMDRDAERAARFAAHHRLRRHDSLEALLDDPTVETVLNLTNPRSHFAVSEASLRAGKHVYSEKPLAMTVAEAKQLVALAEERGLRLSGAPSRVLGEPAQTMWRALRDGAIGRPRLVYAEMDDGLLHAMDFRTWKGASGAPWPYQDELELGCTLEHAGYALTWLAAFFGPAKSVHAFADVVVPDKKVAEVSPDAMGPDFSVACIRYASGVVARLTCSILAPEDHSIRIFGDEGVLSTEDCWKPSSAVFLERRTPPRRFAARSSRAPLRQLRDPNLAKTSRTWKKVDFCLGPLELAAAIRERRHPRLSARFCCHIAELVLAIGSARSGAAPKEIETTFDPIDPMPWAR